MSIELTLLYIILAINVALVFGLRKIINLERLIKRHLKIKKRK